MTRSRAQARLWLALGLVSVFTSLYFLRKGRENNLYLFISLPCFVLFWICWRRFSSANLARADSEDRT